MNPETMSLICDHQEALGIAPPWWLYVDENELRRDLLAALADGHPLTLPEERVVALPWRRAS